MIVFRKGQAADGGFVLGDSIHITKRELEALAMVANGLENADIAKRMGVGVNTVRNHIYNVTQKLRANNRTHAVVAGLEKGLLALAKNGMESTDYVYSYECRHTFKSTEVVWSPPDTVVINHVAYKMEAGPRCPVCKGEAFLSMSWSTVRTLHPEYPEIPDPNVKYKCDLVEEV